MKTYGITHSDVLVFAGLAIGGYGCFALWGLGAACALVGSTLVSLGLVGARATAARQERVRLAKEYAEYQASRRNPRA